MEPLLGIYHSNITLLVVLVVIVFIYLFIYLARAAEKQLGIFFFLGLSVGNRLV